jgi:hypothetical protein
MEPVSGYQDNSDEYSKLLIGLTHVSKPPTHSHGSEKGSFGRLFREWMMVSGQFDIV